MFETSFYSKKKKKKKKKEKKRKKEEEERRKKNPPVKICLEKNSILAYISLKIAQLIKIGNYDDICIFCYVWTETHS